MLINYYLSDTVLGALYNDVPTTAHNVGIWYFVIYIKEAETWAVLGRVVKWWSKTSSPVLCAFKAILEFWKVLLPTYPSPISPTALITCSILSCLAWTKSPISLHMTPGCWELMGIGTQDESYLQSLCLYQWAGVGGGEPVLLSYSFTKDFQYSSPCTGLLRSWP